MSIIFEWNPADLWDLLESCLNEQTLLSLINKYITKGSRILESGCGLGRFVKYLNASGWNIVGLEWSKETLNIVHNVWPELCLITGDCANSPFKTDTFDAVLSLGVIEHWAEGPEAPLRDIYRILKPGGISIISIPCLNWVRKLKRFLWWNELAMLHRVLLSKIIKGINIIPNRKNKYKYAVVPAFGKFYEYHMTKEEFLQVVSQVGFTVLEHCPDGEEDGIYHELNPFKLFVKFANWKFNFSLLGLLVKKILQRSPFLYCHMQIAVVRKADN